MSIWQRLFGFRLRLNRRSKNTNVTPKIGRRGLSITSKFIAAFVALLLLLVQVAMTGFLSLNTVVKETEAAIVSSVEVQRLVFGMDNALQEARRLERDFFWRWSYIGFSAALTDYAETHRQQIDKVLEISGRLQRLIAGDRVSDALRRSNPDILSYIGMVERYSSSFKEAVGLVSSLGIDNVGFLAQLEQNSTQLRDIIQLAQEPQLMVLYREMKKFEEEYLSKRQTAKIHKVSEAAGHLGQAIKASVKLDALQQTQSLEYLQKYESVVQEIVALDREIDSKVSSFDAQALEVSEKLLGLANKEVERARAQISQTSRIATVLLLAAVLGAVLLAGVIANVFATALQRLEAEQGKSERLLLNILPQAIANRLKQGTSTIAESFADVTVLFADIVGFTELSARISPTELVELLNQIFSTFDLLAERHNLEKIKTIGDAYMVVGGLPKPQVDHIEAIADMALDMLIEISRFSTSSGETFNIRIGINTGPVVAGVIGTKKFIYDLWGDTVNIASRMESHGIPGCIQVSEATYERLRDKFHFEPRGAIYVKGKGDMNSYLLKGKF